MTPRTNPDDYLIPCAACGRPTLPGFHSSEDMYVLCGKCNSPDDLALLEKEEHERKWKDAEDRIFNLNDDIDEYNRINVSIFLESKKR